MRGTRTMSLKSSLDGGIIPAHAGNTKMPRHRKPACRDHPRACGEHSIIFFLRLSVKGSSPRMRGTRVLIQRLIGLYRIIPAHAGNTISVPASSLTGGDHPRACGEHGVHMTPLMSLRGSSPRMRGTPYIECSCLNGTGIIPAHAGNTYENGCTVVKYRDHPRACGEHRKPLTRHVTPQGSSPRMRGTLDVQQTAAGGVGIIPAHAGNTQPLPLGHPVLRDHPRACGEHTSSLFSTSACRGSSPRMRGTLIPSFRRPVLMRIIPAHAGNTGGVNNYNNPTRDHPRACGEHRRTCPVATWCKGSSPRMRGTQHVFPANPLREGIIPAHAGNTF